MYVYLYKFTSPPHPHSGNSQGQQTFLALSADNQTCNYDTQCSKHNPSRVLKPQSLLLINTKVKGIQP